MPKWRVNHFATRPALFTIIRTRAAPLSKAFALHAGRLQKTAAADLTDGTATRVAVSDLREFAKILECLGSHEALTFGITGAEQARLCTQGALASGRAPVGAICRDRATSHGPKAAASSCWI